MLLTFRPLKLRPPEWKTPPAGGPFKASWTSTMGLLDRELRYLGASEPVLQVDADAGQIRLDGMLRADARVNHPGVILSFETKKHGTLTYPCCAFGGWYQHPGWQMNTRAIALGLEALRKVERYGIAERGQQYAGWAELPSGIALGRSMTVEEAARFIADHSGQDWSDDVLEDPSFALSLFRDAAKLHHPDQGGDPETFRKLVGARDLLEATA